MVSRLKLARRGLEALSVAPATNELRFGAEVTRDCPGADFRILHWRPVFPPCARVRRKAAVGFRRVPVAVPTLHHAFFGQLAVQEQWRTPCRQVPRLSTNSANSLCYSHPFSVCGRDEPRSYFLTTAKRIASFPFRRERSVVPRSSIFNCVVPLRAEATFHPSGTRTRNSVCFG